jgi:MFS family permease
VVVAAQRCEAGSPVEVARSHARTLLGIAGIGTALGPVVGGVLAATAGWRWVFLLNVPIAVCC